VRGCVWGVAGASEKGGRADVRERVQVCERGGVRVHGCAVIQLLAEDNHAVVWDEARVMHNSAGPAAGVNEESETLAVGPEGGRRGGRDATRADAASGAALRGTQ
jgi:hypothetical protein